MSIQSFNENNNINDFMKVMMNTLHDLNNIFKNIATINIDILQNKYLLKIETNTKNIECEIIVSCVDDDYKFEIVHSKLLKLFIKNTTKKDCVFNLKNEYIMTNNQYKQLYEQFQVVFAYLELIENKNKNMN